MTEQTKTEEKKPLRLSIACGQRKQEGWTGVDYVKTAAADIVHDLTKFPWPIEDNSVEEAECSHYVEHIPMPCACSNGDADPLLRFFDELYRVMKDGAKCLIVCPYYASHRAFQDPTHRRFISEHTFLYANKDWRKANLLDHYKVSADFDFCVSPDTLVLTSDLRWVPASAVKVGTKLIGVDEYADKKAVWRRMLETEVEFTRDFDWGRVKVLTDMGEVSVTPEHPFLVRKLWNGGRKNTFGWIPASDLKAGDEIKFIGKPWSEDYSDSWLAGMYDGEGCLVLPRMKGRSTGLLLTLTQNSGPVLNRVTALLKQHLGRATGLYNKSGTGLCQTACVSNISQVFWILGVFRPMRLLEKLKEVIRSHRLGLPSLNATVHRVIQLDKGPVVAIRTSSRTLITNGFVSHNTYGYALFPDTAGRNQETQSFWVSHYINAVQDIQVTLIKRPRKD